MGLKVLVVDDAAFMRFMITGILKELGHEVIGEAEDGEIACQKYAELKPDLVTMDLIMPKKGGLDALRDIRKADPDARVIVISAGFDAHRLDPLAPITLESTSFQWMTESIRKLADQHCQGRIVSVLEGGYHLDALGESVVEHLAILTR